MRRDTSPWATMLGSYAPRSEPDVYQQSRAFASKYKLKAPMTMAALQVESEAKDEVINALRAMHSAENAALRAENAELRAMLGAQSLLEFHGAKWQKKTVEFTGSTSHADLDAHFNRVLSVNEGMELHENDLY